MSGFEWHKDVIVDAKLNAGKTTQVRKYCRGTLIPRLEQRREWVRCLSTFNPDVPACLRQEMPEKLYFEYLQRAFVLELDLKKRVWRLRFVGFVTETPDGGGEDMGLGDGGGDPGGGGAPPALRPDDGDVDGIAARVAAELAHLRRATEIQLEIYVSRLSARLRALRTELHAASEVARDAWERVEDNLNYLYAMMRLRRAKVATSLTSMVRDMRDAALFAPRSVANLESILVRFGNQTLELPHYRSEQPNWNDWLFGRLIDEDMAIE